ncbi:protein of unknown function [Xylanibacter ruminicola]|uniref:Lipoprotein n=2 Tax=Xylanibacter ruminicola TaxID=839 RepID=A0A1M6TJE2_XYLRU|nr:protein of unknown function [Xylanibacter ruminicola]
MKNLKFLTAVCCTAAMVLTTSCLNDSNDSSSEMTKEQVAYCLAKVKGNYTGNLIYLAKNIKDVKDNTDTLKINWSITNDSTMTIKNFPTRLLASNISDEKLKAALAEQPDQDIECRIGFINTSPVQYLINPKSPSYTVNHDGKDHKIQVAFYVNSTNSFGTYNETKKELYMQIIEGAIFMDDKQTAYLSDVTPFAFEATKN